MRGMPTPALRRLRVAAAGRLTVAVVISGFWLGIIVPAGWAGGTPPADTPAAPAHPGVQWQQLSLDDALKEAAAKNQMIMIDFWSTRCGECGQQENDVWNTPDGARLTDGLIPIRFETSSAEGQDVTNRIPVTGLPSILFLRPDGTEIDRIEGYFSRSDFLRQADDLRKGLDPLPALEVKLQNRPDSLPLVFDVLSRYLNRRRDAEADSLYTRILRLDPQNRTNYPERAIMRMARQAEYVGHDYDKTASYWKTMAELFPNASSIGGAVDGLHECMMMQGHPNEWLDWICGLLDKNPSLQNLNRSAAIVGLRWGYRSPCLAKAARVASASPYPKQKAFMDSIAVVLEGGAPAKTQAGEAPAKKP